MIKEFFIFYFFNFFGKYYFFLTYQVESYEMRVYLKTNVTHVEVSAR